MDMPMSTAAIEPAGGQPISLGKLAKLFRRYVWLIALVAVAGAVAAYVYASTLPKSYTSYSSVAVEGDRFAIPELQGALRGANAPDPMPWVRTEVQALSSPALVDTVVKQLHLDQVPEFNAALRPPSSTQQVKDYIKSLLPGGPGAAAPAGPGDGVLQAAEHALVVTQDNQSLVIGIAFTAQDPKLAAQFVNTLVQDYLSSRVQRRVSADQSANGVLTQRITRIRGELAGLEQQMHDLRGKSELVGLRAGSVGQQQLEELATAAATASVQRAQLEASWQRAAALVKQGSSNALASVLNSPTIAQLRAEEDQAASRLAALTSRYGAGYPGVRSARADLATTQRQLGAETQRIVASLRSQYDVARAHEADVQQQLAAARLVAVKGQDAQAQLQQLQQEVDARRKVYQSLLDQSQQTAAQPSTTQTPDVRILSPAVPSSMPSAPNMKLASGFGMVGGGILGCLIALARIRRVDGFANPAELTEATGMPVLATVPRLSGRDTLVDRASAMLAGPEAETMRLLRARMRTACRPNTTRCVVFTSAAGGGDAAGVAAAFARVAACDGERVLLVEGDLRNPSMGGLMGSRDGDLVAVLQGSAEWRDVLASDRHIPLDLLLSSEKAADSHALLSGISLQNLLVEARDDYNLVVLDAPRASEADAVALAQQADTTVIVVSGRKAHRVETRDAVQRLAAVSRNPIFAVLVTPA